LEELVHIGFILEPVTQQSIIDVTKESPVEEERSVVVHQEPAAVIEEGIKTPVRTDRQVKPMQRVSGEFLEVSPISVL
jgi:hypothetical protein